MQARYKIAFALAAGFTLGAGVIHGLHAAASPPAYVIGLINVKDEEGYKTKFLPEAQKIIADFGGKYVAGGFNKTTNYGEMPPPNRVVILQFENNDKVKAWQDGGGRKSQEEIGSKYADFKALWSVEGAMSK
jgi:uncharacterized protein (DUF1330 family)